MNINKTLIFATVALGFLCTTSNAQQYRFVAQDNSVATKVCVLMGSNEKSKVRRLIEFGGLNKYQVANSYRCNNLSMAKFAAKYNAVDTLNYINRFSHFTNKATPSVTIQDLALNRTNETDTPVVVYVASVR
ncbi:DUF3718 domain-containing protein [Thalassotalea sp. G2M2-11]|uniref:DUF3718 domain-containing protein n=1 Tax=Thalassotalea sp. G2M2-11 TaxID=2787627 RepID=UPI0019D0029A|nr:DUF3718 domain-containing protein [Thalassotalea sp. G2M2-11]